MIRSLHRLPGLVAAVLIVVLALSGAALSVLPAVEVVATPAQQEADLSVAELAARVAAAYPRVEQIKRAPSGRITAWYREGDSAGAAIIDPATGRGIGAAEKSAFERWLTNLHRSLFLGDAGRFVAAAGAAAMLALTVSGLLLAARRTGGWRRFFSPLRGPFWGRLHVEIARISAAGLLLSSVTALWMTASTFGLLPEGPGAPPMTTSVSGRTDYPAAEMAVLRQTPASGLRELTFPYPGDAKDVFTLKTGEGQGYIDQGTGALLAWADLGVWDWVTETIYMLHTGRGAAALGIVLGFMALGVPVMAGTGVFLWTIGRRGRPCIKANAAPGQADTVLLVGGEGGSTWGFAATLHAALTAAGQKVHVAPMSAFSPSCYSRAARVVVLAATYGDGAAPGSAKGFLDRLASLPTSPGFPLAVVGFGDRQFRDFCGYAHNVVRAAEAKGWVQLLPLDVVDRQSPQDFARWGHAFGRVLGIALMLNHQPKPPRSRAFTLVSRRDYGAEVQAPTTILRFALPRARLWQRLTRRGMPHFAAGDLLGILPQGSTLPRFYSLASGSRDGFIEICVRKHPGGLCSGQLMDLLPGQAVDAFVRRNLEFRLGRGKTPVVLIGAGTGIGPLAGFARANRKGRAMHLYFGARHPDSDLLYGEELARWQAEGRLASVTTAFSRTAARAYVQDALRRDSTRLTRLIAEGAQVMVCGGREMATGVARALADILAPAGLTPELLKAEGCYVEDVY
ncbi:N-acetylglucosamine transferase [Mesorhizobium sp. Root695]|uniref:PepSY domain-containing protein n=1 Tax=Mesorhizobium sp. Root695 TaxID=1736589 RepID=UPI00070BFBAE|nr:PepSY domain-containing protein [Mesorhizobium sp. Root695]KRB34487.1 N-acetylglucosamine transferase [Mesorhizobium sp. Root695]